MGATRTSDEDVTRLLSVLRPAPLRAQAQLGTAASTAPVDKRLESSGSETPDELDAPERSTVVPTAVCSKPTPDGLNDAHFSQCHLGSPVRGIRTPGSAWGDGIKRPCLLGEASVRKRLRPQGSARATVIKTRLYQPARSVVRTSGQAATSGRGLHGAIYRRLRAVFPISCGRSPRSGSTWEEAEKVQSDVGTDEDQAR